MKLSYIKTHGHVLAAKKAMWHASVLFTGTTNLLFSTPRISITTMPIYIKFTYIMPSVYATLHTKFERYWPVVHEVCVSENFPIFFNFLFFFFAPFYKSDFELNNNILLVN